MELYFHTKVLWLTTRYPNSSSQHEDTNFDALNSRIPPTIIPIFLFNICQLMQFIGDYRNIA